MPSPFELKTNPVPGSNRQASTPAPMGTVVISLPVPMSEIAITLLRQPLNSRWWAGSRASPLGDSQGASGHWRVTRIAAASISATVLLSSTLTYSLPSPAETANSGAPPKSTTPTFWPEAASITVDEWASPLKVNTRLVPAS